MEMPFRLPAGKLIFCAAALMPVFSLGASELEADIRKALLDDASMASEPNRTSSAGLTKMNPNISLILNVAFGVFDDPEDHFRQGGHSVDEGGFTVQGLEFAASAAVDPYFRFDMNYELSHGHLEEAYLTTLSMPWDLQFRAGYFNAPFGRQNPRHLHNWNFVNPPLSHTRFMGEEHFSGAGAEISWLTPLPWYLAVKGAVFDTKPESNLRSASFAPVTFSESGKVDDTQDFVYVGRMETFFELSPDWSLSLAGSGAWGVSPYVEEGMVSLLGGDLYLKWRPVSSGMGYRAAALTLEYLVRDIQTPGDYVEDGGGYAQIDLYFSRNWLVSARYGNVDLAKGDTPDPAEIPEGYKQRASLALTWLPTHFSKVRLQYDLGRDESDDFEYQALMLQFEVSAGEHGAHSF